MKAHSNRGNSAAVKERQNPHHDNAWLSGCGFTALSSSRSYHAFSRFSCNIRVRRDRKNSLGPPDWNRSRRRGYLINKLSCWLVFRGGMSERKITPGRAADTTGGIPAESARCMSGRRCTGSSGGLNPVCAASSDRGRSVLIRSSPTRSSRACFRQARGVIPVCSRNIFRNRTSCSPASAIARFRSAVVSQSVRGRMAGSPFFQ